MQPLSKIHSINYTKMHCWHLLVSHQFYSYPTIQQKDLRLADQQTQAEQRPFQLNNNADIPVPKSTSRKKQKNQTECSKRTQILMKFKRNKHIWPYEQSRLSLAISSYISVGFPTCSHSAGFMPPLLSVWDLKNQKFKAQFGKLSLAKITHLECQFAELTVSIIPYNKIVRPSLACRPQTGLINILMK